MVYKIGKKNVEQRIVFKVKYRVDTLIQTMEEYANYGFFYMEDKLTDNPDYFFRRSAFLDLFLNFLVDENEDDEELESLD